MSRTLLVALVLLAACEHGQTPVETAIVSPLRTPCQGFGPIMCLTMTPDQQPRENVFFGIEGYTHRWGVESEISLRREPVDPPLPDGPSEHLILIEIIVEIEPVTNPFDLMFPFNGGWFTGSGTQLTMLGGTTVQCDALVCNDVLAANQSGGQFAVTMELVDEQTLRATAVTQL